MKTAHEHERPNNYNHTHEPKQSTAHTERRRQQAQQHGTAAHVMAGG